MEANLVVTEGTDISVVMLEYPDTYEDEGYGEGLQSYWCGKNSEEYDEDYDPDSEWMSYDGCVEFCGFCDGAIDDACTVIEGNGEWAMSMIRRTDFCGLAISAAELAKYKQTSDRYWLAYKRGATAAGK